MRRIMLGRFVEAGSGEVSKGFPVFYEALELPEARHREWRGAVHCKRNMRDIDLEWSGRALPAADLLRSLDLFVYSLVPFFRKSWERDSRSDVDRSDSSGAGGLPFGYLVEEGESGYLCGSFAAYQEAAHRAMWVKALSEWWAGRVSELLL